MVSGLSLMFGDDNKSNSSDTVSTTSIINKDFKYKYIEKSTIMSLEKETLWNLKFKQQLGEKMRLLFT